MHTDTLDRTALIAQLADDAELAAKHLEERREDHEAAKAWALARELRAARVRARISGVEVQGIVYVNLPSRVRSVRAMVNLDAYMDLEGAMQSAVGEPLSLSLDWESFLGDDRDGRQR